MITFGYRNGTNCKVRALIALALGILMLFANDFGNTIVHIAAYVIIGIGVLQLLVFGSLRAMARLDISSVLASAFIIIMAALLLFNPFGQALMRYTAGLCLLIYGLNELRELPKVNKAITDNYGPLGEDKGVDEQ